jgi:hypothetical protein
MLLACLVYILAFDRSLVVNVQLFSDRYLGRTGCSNVDWSVVKLAVHGLSAVRLLAG